MLGRVISEIVVSPLQTQSNHPLTDRSALAAITAEETSCLSLQDPSLRGPLPALPKWSLTPEAHPSLFRATMSADDDPEDCCSNQSR